MKYTVTVTLTDAQTICATIPPSANATTTQEIFRQSFDALDLGKLVVALNQRPRGRPSKPARKEATT